jgi:exosortase
LAAIQGNKRWSVWLLPAFILACWILAIRHLSADWTLNEQYHYGWLVPLLAFYLVKVRFEQCPAPDTAPSAPHTRFILLVITLASILAMPLREANMQWRSMGWWLTALAVGATLVGFAQAGGAKWLRHFAFPVLFFYTAVPILRQIEEPSMHWLMQHNAMISVEVLHWFGIDAHAAGNLIALPSGTLGVDEACSGIRSLQGTLMLTLFLGEILALTWPRRFTLLAAGAGWALATNVGRTVTLGWVADRRGLPAMEGWHDPAGYTVLAICSALVGATAWLLHRSSSPGPTPAASAPGIDRGAIARRFREIAAPSAACLAMLAAGLVLTELWFRFNERSDIPMAPWRFRMPFDRPAFQSTEIAPRIRADLRFDEGYGGRWRDQSGLRWQALYFRWLPGRNAAQTVGVHDPRSCLAAAGMKEVATLPKLEITRADIRLPVDAYHFRDGPHDVFVFNCLVEDVRRSEAQNRIREDNSISSRFVAAMAGKRHRGQRRIEVAVWGAASANSAADKFRELMATQIEVGGPAQ